MPHPAPRPAAQETDCSSESVRGALAGLAHSRVAGFQPGGPLRSVSARPRGGRAMDLGEVTPGLPPQPGADVMEQVRPCCGLLYAQEPAFLERFFAALVSAIPDLEERHAPDGRGFCDHLGRILLWVTLATESADVVESTLQRTGAENAELGFPDDDYVAVGHAFLRASREVLEDVWSAA